MLVFLKTLLPKTGERYFICTYAFVGSKTYCYFTYQVSLESHQHNCCVVTKILSIDIYELSFASLWESVFMFSPGEIFSLANSNLIYALDLQLIKKQRSIFLLHIAKKLRRHNVVLALFAKCLQINHALVKGRTMTQKWFYFKL